MVQADRFKFDRLLSPLRNFFRQEPALRKKLFIYLAIFSGLFFVTTGEIIPSSTVHSIFFVAMFIFWFKSNQIILNKIKATPAFYLAVFFAAGFLHNFLLGFVNVSADAPGLIKYPQLLLFQALWLLMIWSAGLLFTSESKNRQGYLALAALFLFISHHLLIFGHPISQWIFYLMIFYSLMKRSTWLENLSRAELGVYLILVFALYVQFQRPEYFDQMKKIADSTDNALWTYSLPYLLYYTGKIYLIVLLIKIPLVLIYNYAPISRKLWLASLFQSTIPQFVQLALLLFIFFLFISGWQADNLRQEVFRLCKEAVEGQKTTLKVEKTSVKQLYHKTHNTRVFTRDLSVATLQRTSAQKLILFFRPETLSGDSLFAVHLDSTFLRELFSQTNLIIGSGLVAYRFRPNPFLAYLYRIRFWQAGAIRINPLGLINPFFSLKRNYEHILTWPPNAFERENPKILEWTKLNAYPIIVGRIFFSLDEDDTYFAIDIFYDLKDLFQWNFMTQVLLILIFVFFLINSLVIRRVVKLGVQINQLIIRRIAQLRKAVRAISGGNLDYRVTFTGDDEFTELASHFNRMSRDLKRFMNEAREKERLNQELKIAHEVQLKMLPTSLPKIAGYQIAADLTTANEVGGDFYDVFALDDHRYLIAIGDVSGKGMSAAFYMAQIISLLRYSRPFIDDLKKLVLQLNDFLMKEVLDSNVFVTIILGILDAKRSTFQYIRAGHPLPIIIESKADQKALKEIQTKGIGLGITRSASVLEKNLEIKKIKLKTGQTLILYTDGFTEATIEADAVNKIIYGEERFKQHLMRCFHSDPERMLICIKNDLERFYGARPKFDDQTILILQKEPSS